MTRKVLAEQFKETLHKYNESKGRSRTAYKTVLTKKIEEWGELAGGKLAREGIWNILNEIGESYRPKWMIDRLTYGSMYVEKGIVKGWVNDSQVQAISLPLEWEGFYNDYRSHGISLLDDGYVNKWTVISPSDEFKKLGFWEAMLLPIRRYEGVLGRSTEVCFSAGDTLEWLKWGYALPCPLQWQRTQGQLTVTRSIREHGFWEAWKYWDKAFSYYVKNKPELLGELDMWLVHRYYPPQNDPYAAVLGGQKTDKSQNCAKLEPK